MEDSDVPFFTEREPAWLVAAVDQRLAQMKELSGGIGKMARASGTPVVMVFLTEPAGESEAQFMSWEKSCDNCGKFQYFDTLPGSVIRKVEGVTLVFAFGMCKPCSELP